MIKIAFRMSCFLGAFLFFFGCKNSNTDNTQEPKEIPVTNVIRDNVVTDMMFVADINALQNVEIRARVNGYLETIYVDEGKKVTKGQPLFKINDEEYKAALYHAEASLKSAEAELKSARVEHERVRLLVEKEVITKTELDLAQSKIDIALAKIEEAKADAITARVKLSNTLIKSPFTGVIDRIPYKLGSLISEGTLLTTISDISAAHAYFKISEVEYLLYMKRHPKESDSLNGTQVELILADGTPYSHKGKVETMESEFEEETGTLAIRAKFPNPNHVLKHGSNGKIKARRGVDSVLVIPQKAAMEIQDKNYVFIVNKQNMVEMKSFEILQRYKDYYLVKSGLKAGEMIVFEGIQNIREGEVIKPVLTAPSKIYQLHN